MALEVKNLSFSYQDNHVLSDLSFCVEEGALVSVLGPNGVGKSTLFRCILGLNRNYEGEILLFGENVREISTKRLARTVAYIPQSNYPAFNLSVFDMVLMGTTAQVGALQSPKKEQLAAANRALETLGIETLKYRGFLNLSGGERQLVLVARALAQQARLLIMDEPTANLDYGNALRVLEQVRALTKAGYTVIQSTHNPDQAGMFSDAALALSAGQILAYGPPDGVLDEALIKALYGVDVTMHEAGGARFCVPDREYCRSP